MRVGIIGKGNSGATLMTLIVAIGCDQLDAGEAQDRVARHAEQPRSYAVPA